MTKPIQLTAVVKTKDFTSAIKTGEVVAEDIDLNFIEVQPSVAAFRRMVRSLEFDVCELAPITYLAAREAGVPVTALPVFVTREFHHGDFVCRPGSGISHPKDLAGRRVGVRAYTVTTGVWARGILSSEYGVSSDSVTWVVDDEEHVESLKLPENVEHVQLGDSIADQFERGEIDAALTGAAGIGRKGAPKAGWGVAGQSKDDARKASDQFYPLFQDSQALEADWYRRTGIYPIHGLISIKTSILEAEPWIAKRLMQAFVESKAPFVAALNAGDRGTKDLERYAALSSRLGGNDPLPYGVAANEQSLQAMIDFAIEQRIINRRPAWDEIFAVTDL